MFVCFFHVFFSFFSFFIFFFSFVLFLFSHNYAIERACSFDFPLKKKKKKRRKKVVLHKLLSHLQENNLSNPFQSAYQAGHSTETVLLRIVNDILSALHNDNISVLLLLDLSADFDTIDHQILLSRLNSVFGIQFTALQWFQSYYSDRYQSTSVNNSSSLPSYLMYGVPQGSVLGPILFVLYTPPLSDIIANHSVNHQLFADDTQLQKSAPLNEVTNLTKELNACTDDIKT